MDIYIKLVLSYFVLINIISYISMFIDKRKAIKHKWRIKESTLILFALLGGSIGSYLGMKHFRHKTKHLKFTLGIPFIFFLELALVIYFLYIR